MKHIKNTLYVTTENVWIHKDGETITLHKDKHKIGQFPIHLVSEIICYGFEISISPQLVEHCTQNNVTVTYINGNGKFLARLQGPTQGNVLLRRAQYRYADDDEKSLTIAKCCISAKIQNHKNILLRHLRNHSNCDGSEVIKQTIIKIDNNLDLVKKCSDIDILRGLEGSAAESYFSVFDKLILNKDKAFIFSSRSRRPPLNPTNALLSYAYSLLAIDMRSALEAVGLDPFVGYLHTERPGRPSLALDLMEEFRGPIADRTILSLINLKQVSAKGFKIQPNGQTDMDEETRKIFLSSWQKRKKEPVYHSFFEEEMETGLIYIAQARLLARYIRGDIDYYPAFLWR